MPSPTYLVLLVIAVKFALSFQTGENLFNFNYKLNSKLLNSMENDKEVLKHLIEMGWFPNESNVKQYFDDLKTHNSNERRVENLYQFLQTFATNRCLVVINNFMGVDIIKTIELPIILRKFELAFVQKSFVNPTNQKTSTYKDLLWTPKSSLSQINGNFSTTIYKGQDLKTITHSCKNSMYFAGILPVHWSVDHCVGLNPDKFPFASKPWQCKAQIDMFLPESIFKLGIFTDIFRNRLAEKFSPLPSSTPNINILIDSKPNVRKYETVPLISWILRHHLEFHIPTYKIGSAYGAVQNIFVIGHISCKQIIYSNCKISSINVVFVGLDTDYLVVTNFIKLPSLSLNSIFRLEKAQILVSFPGILTPESSNQFGLLSQIIYFVENEKAAISFPLLNFYQMSLKHSDKLQMLGFAYASIYINLMGNVTDISNNGHGINSQYLDRTGIISDIENVTWKYYDLTITNNFANLKFISCGSKGLEPLPFLQFVSVFRSNVWITLLVALVTVTFCIKIMATTSWINGSFIGIMGVFRILLEQGDAFQSSLVNKLRFRFVICGVMLAGLVISNAFKSENMYKIVMPRRQLSYTSFDELVNANFQFYTRIWKFWYDLVFSHGSFSDITNHTSFLGFDGNWIASSESEVYNILDSKVGITPLVSKVVDSTQVHPKAFEAFIEPIKLLAPLVKVGIINANNLDKFTDGKAMVNRFWTKQNEIIWNDLSNCNKSSWILPDYLGHMHARNLRKLGKHSDVGTTAYNKPYLGFILKGIVPTSLLSRTSMIQSSGILEWWPRFINRTDLVPGYDIVRPKPPNMFGNIQVVFIVLGVGIFISIGCIGIELLGTILNRLKLGLKCNVKIRGDDPILSVKPLVKFNDDNVICIDVKSLKEIL